MSIYGEQRSWSFWSWGIKRSKEKSLMKLWWMNEWMNEFLEQLVKGPTTACRQKSDRPGERVSPGFQISCLFSVILVAGNQLLKKSCTTWTSVCLCAVFPSSACFLCTRFLMSSQGQGTTLNAVVKYRARVNRPYSPCG